MQTGPAVFEVAVGRPEALAASRAVDSLRARDGGEVSVVDKEVACSSAVNGAAEAASDTAGPDVCVGSELMDASLSSTAPDSFAASKFLISSDERWGDSVVEGPLGAAASAELLVEAMMAMGDNQGRR